MSPPQLSLFLVILVSLNSYIIYLILEVFFMYTCAYLGNACICQATNTTCIGHDCDCWNDESCGSEMSSSEEKKKTPRSKTLEL